MRVEGPKGTNAYGKSHRTSGAGGGFSLPDQAASSPQPTSDGVGGAAALQSMDAILALQSVDNTEDRERRAVKHGHDLLDQLEALRTDLLAGHIAPQRVGSLLALVRAKQNVEDPKLSGIIDDIGLRARVELAKLGLEP